MPIKGETRDVDRKIRVSVDLSQRSFDRLERVRECVGAASKAEVVRDALQVYEWIVGQTRGGGEFLVREKGGEPQPVILLGVEK